MSPSTSNLEPLESDDEFLEVIEVFNVARWNWKRIERIDDTVVGPGDDNEQTENLKVLSDVQSEGPVPWSSPASRLRCPRPTPAGLAALRRAGVAVALTASAWAVGYRDLGLGPRRAGTGMRWGTAVAVPVLAGYAVAGAVPSLRARLEMPPPASREWLLVRIPLGTVLAEELLFRAVLDAVVTRWLGRSGAVLVGSTVFGLWHRKDGSGWPTVAFTAASGVLFVGLRHRSGSVVAPALLHLAVNAGGAGLRIYGTRFTTA